MALTKVISYIDTIIENTIQHPASKRTTLDHHRLINILQEVKGLIKESYDGRDIEKLREAIHYIEQVPLTSFIPYKKIFRDFLKKNQVPVLNVKGNDLSLPLILNVHKHVLNEIHVMLMDYLKFLLKYKHKETWIYHYKQDPKFIDIIHEWENIQEGLSRDPNQASKDFVRKNIGIKGLTKTNHTLNEISQIIHNLVGKTAYNDNDKNLLKIWLSHNGGQENNRFIDLLLRSQHLIQFQSDILEQHWFNQDGRLYLVCDINLYTLLTEDGKVLYMDPNFLNPNYSNIDPLMIGSIDTIEDCSEKTNPLMRVKALIELDIIDKKQKRVVKPKMCDLQVIGYSNLIKNYMADMHQNMTSCDEEIKQHRTTNAIITV